MKSQRLNFRHLLPTFSVDVLVWDLQVDFHHVGLFPRSTEHAGEIARLQKNDKNIQQHSLEFVAFVSEAQSLWHVLNLLCT